jgi:tetratricopeptide (TPR) repeat protein
VQQRFQIERVAGSGGMGTVYRALDRTTGEPVALKVLRGADEIDRFEREIRVLAGLRHPGIVRYVADGITPSGDPFLAMEWLEGESLAHRLPRSGLTATESIDLARRVAEALGAAHDKGVVHRDVKPSNLFLAGGDLERVKVLDFGVARITAATRFDTRTGVMVGTPGYMAPEQVRGDKDIGPRADVFAIGCVLFECLIGRPLFTGDHMLAVLAKIILEEAPRIAELRPELPEALDDIVHRALARDPELRPRDGTQLAAELAGIGHVGTVERRTTGQMSAALTGTEQRLLCVILVGAERFEGDRTIAEDADVEPPTRPHDPQTWSGELPLGALDQLQAATATYGAALDRLANGSYVVTLAGSGSTNDQVMQAARCALAIKAIVPAAPVALATGRGVIAGRWPVGEAIDRAVRQLDAPALRVRLDDVTAGLLDTRFEIGGDDAGLFVVGERDFARASRTLLGRETPCVGRDRELGVLLGLYEECMHEPVARAVLVTGTEGIGKSRVRHELVRRIQARGEPVELWIGRGDPLRAGSPFGIIAPALRRAAGILDSEPTPVQRHKLRARVSRNLGADLPRMTAFLGELCGVPFPDDDLVELRAARQDPLLMSDQVHRAFEQFLAVETAAQPVVIVLEDLHWGDLPTTKLVDSALRALPDRPWIVLAFARPDLHDVFPRLWADRGVQELRLEELTRKGSEKLVRAVLGPHATDAIVARIVEQAGGNALYLEELVRAIADGKQDLPDTVLALVQGRLERLEGDARKVLRAASVFGQRFWRGGVTKLLGGVARETGTRVWIDELVERELVTRAAASRFSHEEEYQFRHALVREAAYAMLTDADRKLGHQLAGAWLEAAGESSPLVLAEHYERGGELDKAAAAYQRAAELALAACDFKETGSLAERGVRCRARGVTLGALRLAQAEAAKWSGDFDAAAQYGLQAMALLPFGSRGWFAAAGEAAEASGRSSDLAQLASIGEVLRTAPDVGADAVRACVTANAHAAFQLFQHGNYELAQVLLDQVELVARDIDDPGILARIYQTRSSRAMFRGDAGEYLVSERMAAAEFERAGDLRYACMQRGHVGYACLEIGAYDLAEQWLRNALDSGWQLGLQNVVATAKHNLGRALQHLGRLDEAYAIELEAVHMFHAQSDKRLESAARMYLANILVEQGDLDAAEAELHQALELCTAAVRPMIHAHLARILLARRQLLDALAAARQANQDLDALGAIEEGEALVRLMLAETLTGVGDHDGAAAATRRAFDRLMERAAKISDPAWRASFLERIPEHARTVELARRLG